MYCLKFIKGRLSSAKTFIVATLLSVLSMNTALARLPTLEEPSQGKQKGIMATIQAYGYDLFVLGGLFIVAVAIIIAAKNCITEYGAIADGKGSWTKFGAFVVVGVILIVVCIYFVGLAADTLAS